MTPGGHEATPRGHEATPKDRNTTQWSPKMTRRNPEHHRCNIGILDRPDLGPTASGLLEKSTF